MTEHEHQIRCTWDGSIGRECDIRDRWVGYVLLAMIPQLMTGVPIVGRLVAYVHETSGKVIRSGDMGVTSLKRVFTRRPDGCRYTVVAVIVPGEDRDTYAVIDMYNLQTSTGTDVLLGPHMVFASEDAAIAAAQLK